MKTFRSAPIGLPMMGSDSEALKLEPCTTIEQRTHQITQERRASIHTPFASSASQWGQETAEDMQTSSSGYVPLTSSARIYSIPLSDNGEFSWNPDGHTLMEPYSQHERTFLEGSSHPNFPSYLNDTELWMSHTGQFRNE
jgi:hypothetical protein